MRLRNIIVISFFTRMFFATLIYDEFNFWQYLTFADFALAGFNPWLVGNQIWRYWVMRIYPDPPPFVIPMILVRVVDRYLQNEFVLLYLTRLPNFLIDMLSVYYFYQTAMLISNEVKTSARLTLLFGLNPMLIFVSLISNGSFPIAFTVMSVYYFLNMMKHGKQSLVRIAMSAYLLGLGAAFKQYPLILAPAFIAKLRSLKEVITFIVFAALPLFLFSLPFLLWDSTTYLRGVTAFHISSPVNMPEAPRPFQTRARFSIWATITYFIYNTLFAPEEFVLFLNLTALIVLAISLTLLFAFIRKKGTSLISSLTLFLLVLYAFVFVGKGHYFAYYLPFAYLLLAEDSITSRSIRLLSSVLWIPSLAYMLIFSGQWGESGGRFLIDGASGIFWFTHHWLGLDNLAFQYIPSYINLQIIFIPLINFVMSLFFLRKIISFYEPSGGIMFKIKKQSCWFFSKITFDKSRAFLLILLLAVFSIALNSLRVHSVHNVISDNVGYEDVSIGAFWLNRYQLGANYPPVNSNAFLFSDNFSAPALSYNWIYLGDEGSYFSINSTGKPSYTKLAANVFQRSSIQFIMFESFGSIEIRFRFVNLAENATNLIIGHADGGWFGVASEGLQTRFIYFDDVGKQGVKLAKADTLWHLFKIVYNDTGRHIFLDKVYRVSLSTRNRFTYISLGQFTKDATAGGVVDIDWVMVEISTLRDSNPWIIAMSFIGPSIVITTIGVVLYRLTKEKA